MIITSEFVCFALLDADGYEMQQVCLTFIPYFPEKCSLLPLTLLFLGSLGSWHNMLPNNGCGLHMTLRVQQLLC